MKNVFDISKETLLKNRSKWIIILVISIVIYLVAIFLLFFLHNRSLTIWFYIITVILTFIESFFSMFIIIYVLKRNRQYEKYIYFNETNLLIETYTYKQKEGDFAENKYLFEKLTFVDENEEKYTFLLLKKDDNDLKIDNKYQIKHNGQIIYGYLKVDDDNEKKS